MIHHSCQNESVTLLIMNKRQCNYAVECIYLLYAAHLHEQKTIEMCPLSLRGEKATSFIIHQEQGLKGIFNPKIYLPSSCSSKPIWTEDIMKYV